jgi:hypothetical protein
MDPLRRKQAEMLFSEYNRELAKVYDKILDDVKSEVDFAAPDFQSMLQNEVFNCLQPWFSKKLDGLSEDTPEGFFDSLITLDDTMEVFSIAAQMVDGDLPDLLMLRLGAFGEEASMRLLELAMAGEWIRGEGVEDNAFRDGILIHMAALRILGLWNIEMALDPVLARFLNIDAPDELVAESVRDFLVPYGEVVVPRLIACLDEGSEGGLVGPYEYLVIGLTEIGKENASEEIFQCLRRVFRSMEHKVIASVCLGDYGDGRAVPLLKGYLDRHTHDVDRQFFYETLSAIKRLGGDIADITDPFRDFSSKK